MFKFDFKVEDDDTENSPFAGDTITNDAIISDSAPIEWYDSEEIVPTLETIDNIDVCKLNSVRKDFKDLSLCYMVSGFLLEDIKENGEQVLDIKKAEEKHSDLIPAVYEGGAKIWECTEDLLAYLTEHFSSAEWKSKSVLDLGCGSGLLGIFAFKNGAAVTFQDYNKDVLERITIPNVLLNAPNPATEDDEEKESYDIKKLKESTRFYSGDWKKWSDSSPTDLLYDIILTSETIYNPTNQQKLLDCLCDKLKPDGRVFVAAKTYYFGVGGGLRQFEELIQKDQRFDFKSVWLSKDGVNREILELTKIKS